MSRLAVAASIAVGLALVACDDGDRDGPTGPTIVIINTNTAGGPVTSTPSPFPSPSPGTVVRVSLGCFLMRDANGNVIPECGAGLADYICEAPPCTGVLNATPLDASGAQVEGSCVQAWVTSGPCIVDEQAGCIQDAFTPGITINAGSCSVSVVVSGVLGGPRLFIGQ